MGKIPEAGPETLLAAKKSLKSVILTKGGRYRVTTMQSWRGLLQLFGMEVSSKGGDE